MAKLTSRSRDAFDFGPLADDYENWYNTPIGQKHDFMQQQDVLELLGTTSHSGQLLDAGCGTGHWSRFFQSLGYQVQGVDISEKMIRVAKTTTSECLFDIADACALPFLDASFDIVASMATLEFITSPIDALREMVRCVKPGGCLVIGTLNRLAPMNQDRLNRGEQPYASGHLFSPHDLWGMLSPWGQTHMVSYFYKETQSTPSRNITNHQPRPKENMDGPFIIAKVKR